jgi:Carboxypeptidase regulatory-like domain
MDVALFCALSYSLVSFVLEVRFMKCGRIAAFVLTIPFALFSQEYRGTISGVVTDSTGATIAAAKVIVTEIQTGTKAESASDSTGQYAVPFLAPGDYAIAVKSLGFKEFVRKGVHLGAGDHVGVDARLEVGEVSQSVEVTADVSIVNAESASVGQSVTTKEVDELPLNGRTPAVLATLALGVLPTGQPSLIHPFDSGAGNAWNVAGTPAQTSETMVDGVPNATWDGRLAYSLPQDAVQEVRIKAFDSDASFGHTGGGTLNQVMKTGTNDIHGSLWEYNQPNTLTANDFFNNAKSVQRPVSHLNQYGLTAGGPIWIPKVFNGKNKLFWFFAFEGMKDGQPNPVFLTIPTAAERTGNLSQFLTADKTQLYDPYSAVVNGSTITRSPIPNNIIPTNELSPIAQAYMKYYPAPNVAGTADGQQNYGNSATTNDNFNNEMGRLDYNMSPLSRLAFNVRKTDYSQVKNNYFNNIAEGSILKRANWGATLDEVYTFNATNVLDVRANFTRMAENHDMPSQGFDPASLGLPSYLAANSRYVQMPVVAFSSTTNMQGLSATGADQIPSQSVQLYASWVRIMGNHTLKFGTDERQYRLNTFTAGSASGQFSFSGNSWVRASSSASSTVTGGQDLASFLLGLPYTSSGSVYDINTYGSWYSYYASGFVQDDWRLKRNLTVALGLRYESDNPYHETWGRTVNGFDTTTASPLAAAAQAAYAKAPSALLPASAFNVLGGLSFATPGNNEVFKNTSHLFSPRGSLAWSPEKLHGKTVIRAGFGMFESPIAVSYVGPDGKYSTSPRTPLGQEGFSQSTALTATANNYALPGNVSLSNPFPTGFLQPAGASAGLLTYAGQTVQFLNPEMKNGYSLRWDFDIQQQLGNNLALEVAYIGNHGVHLPVNVTQLNGIPRQFLSTLGVRDAATSALTASIANPFSGLATSQNTATTTVAQLLSRYPQFPVGDSSGGWSGSGGILEFNNDIGSSYFQSLNVHLTKRTSKGLMLTTNFIYSKMMERMSWLNDSDATLEKRVSPNDRPLRLVLSAVYELPIGRGKRINFQSRLANTLIGGWKITSIYSRQSGAPINWVNGSSTAPGDYVYFGGPLNLNNRQVNGTAFDKTAFDTLSADAFQYHIRTFSTTFGNLRADGINQLDSSILKRFNFGESVRKYFELRGEMFNVPNHPVFAAPNTTASNAQFGQITATVNRFRTMQVSARLVF